MIDEEDKKFLEKEKTLKRSERQHYVSNKKLFKEYCDWYAAIDEAEEKGEPEPPMPDYIVESMIKITSKLSYRPNFINYSYRDEMVADAIENCIKAAKNFNREKSENPFSYITTIAYNAFLRRIESEKKQTYIKGKLIETMPIDELMEYPEGDDSQYHNQFIDFLRENNYIDTSESPAEKKRKKKKAANQPNLGSFIE